MLAFRSIKAVQIKRDPMDTILSNYKSYFTNGQHFSYDIDSTIEYLKCFYTSCAIWKQYFGDRICEISYEQYVASPEQQNTRIAESLGNNASDYTFSFQTEGRVVQTANANQLGSRIHSNSFGKAKNYMPFLKEWDDAIAHLYEARDNSKKHTQR